jgi:hypothetical protein
MRDFCRINNVNFSFPTVNWPSSRAIDNGLVIGNGFKKLKREYAACADKSCFATLYFGEHKRYFEVVL